MRRHRDKNVKGSWLTYRPEIKVHDCTIRDGGLISDHRFEDGFVEAIYETGLAAGADYMELGYSASKRIFVSRLPCEPAAPLTTMSPSTIN